jgi:hypothetical protein
MRKTLAMHPLHVLALLGAAILLVVLSPFQASATETDWQTVGPSNVNSSDAPAVVVSDLGVEFQAWRGEGSGAQGIYYSLNSGTPQQMAGATSQSAPSLVNWNGVITAFHRGTGAYQNRILYSTYNFGWSPWTILPDNFTTIATPSLSVADGAIHVAYTGTNNRMYLGSLDTNFNWEDQGEFAGGGVTTHSPAITTTPNQALIATHTQELTDRSIGRQ